MGYWYYGGLKAVAFTDIMQVVLLVLGGLKLAWPELPFIDRGGVVFLLWIMFAVVISLAAGTDDRPGSVDLTIISFQTSSGFNLSAALVRIILITLYATWW